jgi:hypothetical protein
MNIRSEAGKQAWRERAGGYPVEVRVSELRVGERPGQPLDA